VTTVSFPTSDGGRIYADEYGTGARDVILAHGAVYDKESWKPQAEALAAAGFHVIAIDFRGYGKSYGPATEDPGDGPLDLDVLAAAAYARANGAKSVAVVGASMGARAAGDATIEDAGRKIDRLVLLAGLPSRSLADLRVPVLFLVSRDDGGIASMMQAQLESLHTPKKLVVLPGSAHAQAIFRTDQSGPAMDAIITFLNES
jgi:pimeloyl-ACP methyl ester carboxylesterase